MKKNCTSNNNNKTAISIAITRTIRVIIPLTRLPVIGDYKVISITAIISLIITSIFIKTRTVNYGEELW